MVTLLLSCRQDDLHPSVPLPGGSGETEITFSMQLPGNYAPQSRSLGDPEECDVRSVEVMVFDNATDRFLHIAYAADITGTGRSREFTVTLPTGTGLDIVVLTNSRAWIEKCLGNTIAKGTARTQIEQALIADIAGKWDTDPSAGNTSYIPIPMYGEKRNVTIDADTDFTGIAGRISLSRMLAKVEVTVATAAQGDFDLKEVYLYHPYDKGLIIPSAASWDTANNIAKLPSLLPGWTSTGTFLKYDGTEISKDGAGRGVACEGEIYTFEAAAGTTANHTANTFLIIGGEFNGDMCYYRIDFAVDGTSGPEYLDLLRNHLYSVNIRSISAKGFDTAPEAAKSLPMNIDTDIAVRNDGDIGYYVYDGQYYLGAEPHEVVLWRDGGLYEILVNTDFPEGWEVESVTYDVPTSPDWLHINGVTGNTVVGVTGKVEYEADPNTTGSPRTAYINLTAGLLELTVTVVQQPWYIADISVSPVGMIPQIGDTRTVTIEGVLPATEIRAIDLTGSRVLDKTSVPATAANATSTTAVLTVPYIPDGRRLIGFEYLDEADNQWKTISIEEQKRVVLYSTKSYGRVVSLYRVKDIYGTPDVDNSSDEPNLTWAQAMGISDSYNSAYLYNLYGGTDMNNPDYILTAPTGCGAYSEEGYPAGTWRLPTLDELKEMHLLNDVIGNYTWHGHWTSTEKNDNPTVAYRYVQTNQNSDAAPKNSLYYLVRCVREDNELNYAVTTDHTKGDPISAGGQTVLVTANGYFPTLYVRGRIDSSATPFDTGTIYGARGTVYTDIAIPVNTGSSPRDIVIEYSEDGITWEDPVTWGQQKGISLEVSTTSLSYTGLGGTQNVTVTWEPSSLNVSAAMTGNISASYPTSITNGSATVQVQVNAMNAAETASNPFLEKNSVLTFTLNVNGTILTRTLNIKQQNYTVQTNLSNNTGGFMMDATNRSFNIRSNARWTASYSGNAITSISNTSGAANTTYQGFSFMMNQGSNTNVSANSTITFSSPDGLFNDVTVTILGNYGYTFRYTRDLLAYHSDIGPVSYDAAVNECAALGDGWRVPNSGELSAMLQALGTTAYGFERGSGYTIARAYVSSTTGNYRLGNGSYMSGYQCLGYFATGQTIHYPLNTSQERSYLYTGWNTAVASSSSHTTATAGYTTSLSWWNGDKETQTGNMSGRIYVRCVADK